MASRNSHVESARDEREQRAVIEGARDRLQLLLQQEEQQQQEQGQNYIEGDEQLNPIDDLAEIYRENPQYYRYLLFQDDDDGDDDDIDDRRSANCENGPINQAVQDGNELWVVEQLDPADPWAQDHIDGNDNVNAGRHAHYENEPINQAAQDDEQWEIEQLDPAPHDPWAQEDDADDWDVWQWPWRFNRWVGFHTRIYDSGYSSVGERVGEEERHE